MAPLHRIAAAALLGLAAQGASAQFEVSLPSGLFGHLDQFKTACAGMGCGPTAAVNSFVYLQNYYAGLSVGPKAPAAPTIVTDFTEAGLVKLADSLGMLMGCNANCGTSNIALNKGKKDYLTGRTGGWTPVVTWNNKLVWKWITDTLKDGVDVELLVGDGTLSHYITLTGYKWTDANNNGRVDKGEATIHFIDPAGGTDSQSAIEVDAAGAITLTGYDLDETTPQVPPVSATDGFAERLVPSGVPEPATWGLLLAGAALLALRARARPRPA